MPFTLFPCLCPRPALRRAALGTLTALAAAATLPVLAQDPSNVGARGPQAASAPGGLAAPAGPATGRRLDLSLTLNGAYQASSRDPADYRMPGFQWGEDAGPGPQRRGLGWPESELGLQASFAPGWRGVALVALDAEEGTAEVEEAYVQVTGLGAGLTATGGRFLSGIGYLNAQHAHTWDFADNPLAYQVFLGTQLAQDGVQLRWLAPTDRYLSFGVELGRGRGFPAAASAARRPDTAALTVHTGGDIGESQSWRAGVSWLLARATGQSLALTDARGAEAEGEFGGRTRLWMLDGVWKWAPAGNAARTSVKVQGEYLRSTRSGTLRFDPTGADVTDRLRLAQSGAYLQAVWQFMPRWRAGLRGDWLDAGRADYGANAADLAGAAHRPRRHTAMLDFSPTETSRLRLQLAQDRGRPGGADRQLVLQYTLSLGAHPAHAY